MKPFLSLSLSTFYLIFQSSYAFADIPIARFETESLSRWQQKSFDGYTQYDIVTFNGQRVLKAQSRSAASILAKPFKIDLKKTPYLNWSWRIENTLPRLNERTKQGDDYAARLYIIQEGGWASWNTKALNYVWSSNQPKGSRWNNAFAGDKAKMLAVRGRKDPPRIWLSEKRNVYQDLINSFGDKGSDKQNEKAYRFIDAVAIMTDTDNSHTSAIAYYGDIYFSEK